MGSQAWSDWQVRLMPRLDELEELHTRATGFGPGRRWGTRQLNGHLFVALVGQFQGFARALHDEALDWLRTQGPVASVLAQTASQGRMLDRGNPSGGSLGQDFGKIGLQLTTAVRGRSQHGAGRLDRLAAAVDLRNGIAHDDASKIALAQSSGARPTLPSYRTHRRAIERLTVDMDVVVAHHLGSLVRTTPPW